MYPILPNGLARPEPCRRDFVHGSAGTRRLVAAILIVLGFGAAMEMAAHHYGAADQRTMARAAPVTESGQQR